MPIPGSYTEQSLAAYMHDTLGAVATALGYDPLSSYSEAVSEAVLQCGLSDVAECSGTEAIRLLRAQARAQAWQKVANDTAGDYDFRTADSSFSRSQVHKQALQNLSLAQAEADRLLEVQEQASDYTIGVASARHVNDPYQYWPEDER